MDTSRGLLATTTERFKKVSSGAESLAKNTHESRKIDELN
jgi:hypothetical protein